MKHKLKPFCFVSHFPIMWAYGLEQREAPRLAPRGEIVIGTP